MNWSKVLKCYVHSTVTPGSCKELKNNGEDSSGVYTIKPDDGEPFEVSILS